MLSWLDSFWKSATGYVAREVATAVHWAEHAIMGVILNVFGLVARGWRYFQQGAAAAWSAVGDFAHAVWVKFDWILHTLIPSVLRWAQAQLAALVTFAHSIWSSLLALVKAVDARLTAAIAAIVRWVAANVWAPLQALALRIWHDLTSWAQLAVYYSTHPQALADLLLLFLVNSLEARAWQVAQLLGRFTLSLIVANLRRVALLVEDVLTAVL